MELKKLWDENSDKAQELHGVASLLYDDNYIIIFDSYIFIIDTDNEEHKATGSILNSNGEVEYSDVYRVIPLILGSNKLPVGWVIWDNEAKNNLSSARAKKHFIKAVSNANKYRAISDESKFNSTDILQRLNKNTIKVKIIQPDGSIGYGVITDCIRQDLKFNGNIYYCIDKGIDGIQYVCNGGDKY